MSTTTLCHIATLEALIGMTGANVIVTANTDSGHPVLAVTGTISMGVEVLGAQPGDTEETIYFPLDIGGTGFLITRSVFTGAQWHGDVLHVELGLVTLMIEPSD
jgi:hypothetical protein